MKNLINLTKNKITALILFPLSLLSKKMELDEWQIQKVEQGLKDVESENYATEEEINRLFKSK